jgi:hypothetical protein
MSNHHHTTPSRVYNTPRAYLAFYSLLDALAFIMGVMLGAFILGRMMAWYYFG